MDVCTLTHSYTLTSNFQSPTTSTATADENASQLRSGNGCINSNGNHRKSNEADFVEDPQEEKEEKKEENIDVRN